MLTKNATEALKKNESAKGRIATATGRTVWSVNRWLYGDAKDQLILTSAVCLQIIREETGLTDEEILEPSTVNK